MRPEIVTFWRGPLDPLRLVCLRSQVAAGHKVTVYSFDPLPGLPDGIDNAEAEAVLPYSFSNGSVRRKRTVPGATGPRCSSAISSVSA